MWSEGSFTKRGCVGVCSCPWLPAHAGCWPRSRAPAAPTRCLPSPLGTADFPVSTGKEQRPEGFKTFFFLLEHKCLRAPRSIMRGERPLALGCCSWSTSGASTEEVRAGAHQPHRGQPRGCSTLTLCHHLSEARMAPLQPQ